MINVLHIALDFNSNSGVTTYVTMLLRHFSKRPGYTMHLMTNGENAIHRLKDLPVSPVLIPMERGVRNVVHAISNVRSVKTYCEEHAIQLIHTHHRYPELIASLVSLRLDVATMTTAHSIVQGFKVLSFRSDKIIAVSDAARDSIIQRFAVNPSKLTVMHNPVEPLRLCSGTEIKGMRRKLEIPGHHKIILYLGRFDPLKGVKYLLNAFRKISAERTDLTLLLVGGTGAAIERDPTFHILRVPAQEDTAVFYQLSDLVVLPSEQDSFPYTMLETGLAGKPFVGSRVGGIAEFIEEGKDGLLFTPGDEEALSRHICRIIDDPVMANTLGKNLCHKVHSLPSCDEYCDGLGSMYNELVGD